jgi:hypothetical protein
MDKSPYQEYNESKQASFSDKEREALADCMEWVENNWQDFSPEEYPQIFTLVSGPDDKREVYRNEFFHVMYAYSYDYVDILPLDED